VEGLEGDEEGMEGNDIEVDEEEGAMEEGSSLISYSLISPHQTSLHLKSTAQCQHPAWYKPYGALVKAGLPHQPFQQAHHGLPILSLHHPPALHHLS
jgi:hypothetical protein